ncbi:MAG: molybdopterin adenylyltransferase [Dehalococcoidales bacterium]
MINIGILTVSDKGSKGLREDKSGPLIGEMIQGTGVREKYEIVPDEKDIISAKLIEWAEGGKVDVILTNGGTGLSARDVTPEATLAVIDRSVPGIAEAMRAKSVEKTPTAMLSRAVAGQRGQCLIINLPGSAKAVRECLEAILPVLPHAVEIIKGTFTEHDIRNRVEGRG